MLTFQRLRRSSAVAAFFGLLLFAACGDSDHAPGLVGVDGTSGGGAGGTSGKPGSPCADGSVQECSITLGRQGGVLSCFHGTQACVDGCWLECSDGTLGVEG